MDPFRKKTGRSISLSAPRRLICDLLHFARKVPTVPVQRQMNLSAVVEARARCRERVSWCAIFLKAMALTAEKTPEFRRAFLTFPTAHLYESPFSVASVAVERQIEGENAVLFARLIAPETLPLWELETQMRLFQGTPVEKVHVFKRALMMSRMPWFLRRMLWWFTLNVSGASRAWRVGTFGISVYSALGAESLHPLSPLTTTLNYGIIDTMGRVPVRIVYDHRVMDGATVARGLLRMEEMLNTTIVDELWTLAEQQANFADMDEFSAWLQKQWREGFVSVPRAGTRRGA
jgi:hypothetical protein